MSTHVNFESHQRLFHSLSERAGLDEHDWNMACRFAQNWKISVADACADLHFVDETVLAKVLAELAELPYLPGHDLQPDFDGIDFETYEDLILTGSVPTKDGRLAICHPLDDHRGILNRNLCDLERIVTERSAIFKALGRRRKSD